MTNTPLISTKTIMHFPRPGRISVYFNSRFRSLDIEQDTVKKVLSLYDLVMAGKPKNLPNARRNTNLIIEKHHGK
jgi:hypothetical protein